MLSVLRSITLHSADSADDFHQAGLPGVVVRLGGVHPVERRGLLFLQPPDCLPAAQLHRSVAIGHAELSQCPHHRTVPVLAAGSKRESAGRSRGGRLESAPGTFRGSWRRPGTAAGQVFDAEIAELEDHEVRQREVTAAVPSVD